MALPPSLIASRFGLLRLALLLGVALLSGCGNLARLAADIRESGAQLRVVSGTLGGGNCRECEWIVVVMGDERGEAIHNFRVFEQSGPFRIAALRSSRYLFAFQDSNRDFSYQPGEPAAWHDLKADEMLRGVPAEAILQLGRAPLRPPPAGLERLFDLRGTNLGQIDVQLGVVTDLSDGRFSEESATMGMWEPLGFMKAGRAGIFFLEPYDPTRTPVLFVHGIRGTPRSFAGIIDTLDRRRFQAWVLNYPSGLDLRALGDGLVGLLAELRHRYGFGRLHIVSHSMGGLLTREYLAECARSGSCDYVSNVVSISTPFGGIAAMGSWLEYARVVMPVWRNLAPDGPFLRDLFALPLPSGVSYHLLFGYRNDDALSRGSSDGVIPLDSQLLPAAQAEAVEMRGYNEDHVSILGNAKLQHFINEALQRQDLRRVSLPSLGLPVLSRSPSR